MALPQIDLYDKNFEDLIDEAKKLIPIYSPQWTDYHLSDPGITFIELLAWLTEGDIYRMNQITDKHKIKYLTLLGTKPNPKKQAVVDITFQTNINKEIKLSKGTLISTDQMNDTIDFELMDDIVIVPVKLEKVIVDEFINVYDRTASNINENLNYAPFGLNLEKRSALYLGFKKNSHYHINTLSLMCYLYEKDLIQKGFHGEEEEYNFKNAKLKWEYSISAENKLVWQSINPVVDETKDFKRNGRIIFKNIDNWAPFPDISIWKDLNNEYFWLRSILIESNYEYPPRINTIRINTVPASQGKTITDDTEQRISNGLPNQKCNLFYKNVLYKTLVLYVNDEKWEEQDNFDGSKAEDNHFVVDRVNGTILFGDGLTGRVPLEGSHIRVITYKIGGGEIGNVTPTDTWRIDYTLPLTIKGFSNSDDSSDYDNGAQPLHPMQPEYNTSRIIKNNISDENTYIESSEKNSIDVKNYSQQKNSVHDADSCFTEVVEFLIDKIFLRVHTPFITIDSTVRKGTGHPHQKIDLLYKNVLHKTLKLFVNNDEWEERYDFDNSNYNSKHYILYGFKGMVEFGNGIFGKIPPKNSKIITPLYQIIRRKEGDIYPPFDSEIELYVNLIMENIFHAVITLTLEDVHKEDINSDPDIFNILPDIFYKIFGGLLDELDEFIKKLSLFKFIEKILDKLFDNNSTFKLPYNDDLMHFIEKVYENIHLLIKHQKVTDDNQEIISNGKPSQIITLKYKDILVNTTKLLVNGEQWEECYDFNQSNFSDKHFVVDRNQGSILFGNGIHGAIPSQGAVIKIAEYQTVIWIGDDNETSPWLIAYYLWKISMYIWHLANKEGNIPPCMARLIGEYVWNILFLIFIIAKYICDHEDHIPPKVNVVSPSNGAKVSETINIKIHATDNVDVIKVECYIDDVKIDETSVHDNNTYTIEWNTLIFDNGEHRIMAKAYDSSGNVGVDNDTIVYVYNDNTNPVVDVIFPSNGAKVSDKVNVKIHATDDVAVIKVECYVDDVKIEESSVHDNNIYTIEWNTWNFSNGEHRIMAKAYDSTGNVGIDNDTTVYVLNDITSPEVEIIYPSNNQYVKGKVNVKIHATDDIGVVKVECYIDSSKIGEASLQGDDIYTIEWDSSEFSNGEHHIKAKAHDAKKNVGIATIIVFTDNASPAVEIIYPSNNEVIDKSISIEICATDNVSVAKVEVFADDIKIGESMTSVDNIYTIDWNIEEYDARMHNLKAKAYDFVGNIGISKIVSVYIKPYLKAINYLPGMGGLEDETIQKATVRFLKDIKVPYTTVTSEDIEYIAIHTPGLRIANVRAIPNYHPKIGRKEGSVTVVVIPFTPLEEFAVPPRPSEGFKRAICDHLDKHRLIGMEMNVISPDYIMMDIKMTIIQFENYKEEKIRNAIIEKLNEYIHPIKGGKDGSGWPIGENVYISEIYNILEDIEGIDAISELILSGDKGAYRDSEGNLILPTKISTVYSGNYIIDIIRKSECS